MTHHYAINERADFDVYYDEFLPRGLAFDPGTDKLYGSDVATDQLITIDTTTTVRVVASLLRMV